MTVESVKWGAGVFITGALNLYIWNRPRLNFNGLSTLALGGLSALTIQSVINQQSIIFEIGKTVFSEIKRAIKENPKVFFFISSIFLSGAINRYVWIRPALNFAGLRTLTLGGLYNCTLFFSIIRIMKYLFEWGNHAGAQPSHSLILPILFSTYTIMMIGSIGATIPIAKYCGIQFDYKEGASVALVLPITAIFGMFYASS